jgi:hypothetical protein
MWLCGSLSRFQVGYPHRGCDPDRILGQHLSRRRGVALDERADGNSDFRNAFCNFILTRVGGSAIIRSS